MKFGFELNNFVYIDKLQLWNKLSNFAYIYHSAFELTILLTSSPINFVSELNTFDYIADYRKSGPDLKNFVFIV